MTAPDTYSSSTNRVQHRFQQSTWATSPETSSDFSELLFLDPRLACECTTAVRNVVQSYRGIPCILSGTNAASNVPPF
eukprot:772156-Rhodomonas_salina.1